MELRSYQATIVERVKEKGNTLVVLPTGLGKTLIALKVMEWKLAQGGKALFLAPTKPLVFQHEKSIQSFFPTKTVVAVTGALPATKRADAYARADIIVATPQTIKNDLERGIQQSYSLVVFDEAHRCVGNYAYTYVAQSLRTLNPSVLYLALTASPGSKKEKIARILETLGILHMEIRTEDDEEVRQHIPEKKIQWIRVPLSPLYAQARRLLDELIAEKRETLKKMGFVATKHKSHLLKLRDRILECDDKQRRMIALMHFTQLFSLVHAQELVETQSLKTAQNFLQRLSEKKSRAATLLLRHSTVQHLLSLPAAPHPKTLILKELIAQRPHQSIIVFVQYRDQINQIIETLRDITAAEKFVGRAELTQKEQQKIIERFRQGAFRVLVASSVGEEGLDIPSVDCVIFYEPIPSEIRAIQRRGRAGRTRAGEVIILIAEHTRDEAYLWVSKKKEARMRSFMHSNTISRSSSPPNSLSPTPHHPSPPPGSSKTKTLLDFM